MPRLYNGDALLAKHPKLLKWMNICVVCNQMGHKPELPNQIHGGKYGNSHAAELRLFFRPMAVDELGLCEDCQRRKTVSNRE